MAAPDSSLPPDLTSALLKLLDADDEAFEHGLADLCRAHPEHSAPLVQAAQEARAGAGRGAVSGAAGKPPTNQRGAGLSEPARPTQIDPRLGTRVGNFQIQERLGEGGMGVVYLAEQRAPVQRRVALKVIKLGMDTHAVLARFEAERQALAMMNHSNIAKVLEAGTTPDGKPYFAMEYVHGIPITVYCDRSLLSIEDRLALFRQVCSGVQHAHTKGVIHRDLTPNNVLVTLQDGKPAAKIIDFGLARATDRRLTEKTLFTEQGVILGTPEYMSPEQAGLNALDIDMRSDVYTLGVLLYELLTGKLPFETTALRAGGYDAMCKTIREADPPRPSNRVTTHAGGTDAAAKLRRTSAGTLLKRLRGDLDWVVLKCLEKDRLRRYETVSELAGDIQRHLDGEPVLAHAPSAAYRLSKFAKRHRGELVAVTAVFVALLGGLGLSVYFWRDALAQATEATDRRREAEQATGIMRYERAVEGEKKLYPPWPKQIPAMERWLREDAGKLLAMRPETERAVNGLRLRAQPPTDEESEHDRATQAVSIELLGKLASLDDKERKAVDERLSWARRIEALTLGHPRAQVTWQQAREAIKKADGVVASKLYRGQTIELRNQDVIGMVPIGMNPATKLWEFYELRSAWDWEGVGDPAAIPIPRHAMEGERLGHIDVGKGTGIVFVLLPGGTFTMGSQNRDPNASNYYSSKDPKRNSDEVIHEVTLAPFFLARHEMTQGQWRRLSAGDIPSHYKPDSDSRIVWPNPVENVSWTMCDTLLARHGLSLPTEAQWEYGCRGGTTTPWWTGADRESLRGAVNLADQTAKQAGIGLIDSKDWPNLDDGFALHAPVDALRPNPYGMHNVHGNVWEWCKDSYLSYSVFPRVGDGLREMADGSSPDRVIRGGSFHNIASSTRSAYRSNQRPTQQDGDTGLRPARASRLD